MPLPRKAFARALALLLALACPLMAHAEADPGADTIYEGVADNAGETPIVVDSPAFVEPLLEVARAELGYTEGLDNQSKYGLWAGDEHAAWCAEFVCWCVSQTDAACGTQLLNTVYPLYSGQNTGRDWFIARGRFACRKGNLDGWGYQWLLGADTLMKKNEYVPRPGDLMFFAYNDAGDTEHVALVEYSALDARGAVVVHVIEGNNPDRVQRNSYYLDNSQVLGFGCCEDVIGTTMRFGNAGDKVLALQNDLNELGFLGERHVTGTFGSNTRAAVASFQRFMGLSENGMADLDTQAALAAELERKHYADPDSWLVQDEEEP